MLFFVLSFVVLFDDEDSHTNTNTHTVHVKYTVVLACRSRSVTFARLGCFTVSVFQASIGRIVGCLMSLSSFLDRKGTL